MKALLVSLFIISNISLFGQFPAPSNLYVDVCYREMDSPIACSPDLPEMGHRLTFSWDTPDTSSISSTLSGYKIYNQNNVIAFPNSSPYEVNASYNGNFYVTAVYSNPNGESEPSNVFNISLPLLVDESKSNKLKIYPNPFSDNIFIIQDNQIKQIKLFSLQGQLLLINSNITNCIETKNLTSGVYYLEIILENNLIINMKMIK